MMTKRQVFILTCSLLLSAGVWNAPVVHGAESKVKVSIDQTALNDPDGSAPYVNGSVVMVPVRAAGETLGFEVNYIKEQNSLQLTGKRQQYTFKLGTGELFLNEKDKLAVAGKAVLRNNRFYVPLTWFEKLGFLTSYDAASAQAAVIQPQHIVESVLKLLSSGQFDDLRQQYFTEDLLEKLPASALKQGWDTIGAPLGSFIQLESAITTRVKDDEIVIVSDASFTQGKLNVTITVNSSGKLIGLIIAPSAASPSAVTPPKVDLPAEVVEDEIVLGAGTAHPLRAKLTLPKNAAKPLPAVVLVQGSGPSDLDETVLGYKPFRDIAYGLAEQGIAVIRYDKRTFAYPKEQVSTVKEETVEDAIAASNLLKQDKRIDPSRVFLAGHSLGGMLAPRIDDAGGHFVGLILLAGSPRPLWEIVYDQNLDVINQLDDTNPLKAPNAALIAAELEKARKLASLSDDEAKQAPDVFGQPAYYLKEMDQHSTAGLAKGLTKPVLVLQGSDDFQVYADKDFPLWKELLKNNSSAEFKLYPGLNHFFVNYDGAGAGTLAEYSTPGVVDPGVITDMGEWINRQK